MKYFLQLAAMNLIALTVLGNACLIAQATPDYVDKHPEITAKFVELAKQYGSDQSTFQFRSTARSFGHLEKPWATRQTALVGEFVIVNDRLVLRESRKRASGESEETTVFTQDNLYQMDGDKRALDVTRSDHQAFLKYSCRFTPAVLLQHVATEIQEVKTANILFSMEEGVLSVRGGGGDFEIEFSKDGKVAAIRWNGTHEMWGNEEVEFQYSSYKKTTGELSYPSVINAMTFDVVVSKTEILSADDSDSLENVKFPVNYSLKADPPTVEKVEVETYNDNVTFLHVTHCDSRTALIEFKDFLMVIDAPKSSRNGKLILDKIDELKLGKPIKYFAFGHHHPHYLGGVRPFVARGVTVLTTEKIVPYLKKIVGFSHSRKPDALEHQPKQLVLQTFERQTKISDGEYEVKIFDIGMKSKHTIDYLLFYFPKEKLLFQDDGIWLRAGEPLRGRTLATFDAITELKLDVDDSIQGWPTQNYNVETKIKFAELELAAKGVKPTKDPSQR